MTLQQFANRARRGIPSHIGLGLTWCVLGLSASCSSQGLLGDVGGTVTVDGAPVDIGTIHFRPVDDSTGLGGGAGIKAGAFSLGSNHQLKSGKYAVAVQASKNTGRIFDDPQRGKVPMLVSVDVVDSPQEIELTNSNADQLDLTFSTQIK